MRADSETSLAGQAPSMEARSLQSFRRMYFNIELFRRDSSARQGEAGPVVYSSSRRCCRHTGRRRAADALKAVQSKLCSGALFCTRTLLPLRRRAVAKCPGQRLEVVELVACVNHARSEESKALRTRSLADPWLPFQYAPAIMLRCHQRKQEHKSTAMQTGGLLANRSTSL